MLFFLLLLICFCLFEGLWKAWVRGSWKANKNCCLCCLLFMRNEFFLFANDKQLKHIVLRWSFAKKRPFQTDKRTETQSVDPSVYLLGLGGTFFWIFQSSHGLHEKTSIVCQQYWWSFNIISTGVLGKLWGLDQQPSSGCLVLCGLSAFWTLASFHRSKIRWSYNYVRTWKII